MKDQMFSGRTVAEALEVAGRTLGLAPDALRYVILERESAGAMGMGGSAARIAVLLETKRGGTPGPVGERPGPVASETVPPAGGPAGVRASIRAFVREFASVTGLDVTAEIDEGEERTIVRLFGSDRSVLLDKEGEVLLALDHILQRAFGRDVHPSRLVVECDGFREARDAALGERARVLAEDVSRDGKSRETEPLNSYERRIVHMTLSEHPSVRTFSVGEGQDRRVTIALREPGAAEGQDGGGSAH